MGSDLLVWWWDSYAYWFLLLAVFPVDLNIFCHALKAKSEVLLIPEYIFSFFKNEDICILLSTEAQLRPYCTCTLSSCPRKPIFVFLVLAVDDLTVVKGNVWSGHLLAVQSVWMGPYGVILFPAGTRLQPSPLGADYMSDLINDNILVCLMTSLLMGGITSLKYHETQWVIQHVWLLLVRFLTSFTRNDSFFLVHFTDCGTTFRLKLYLNLLSHHNLVL